MPHFVFVLSVSFVVSNPRDHCGFLGITNSSFPRRLGQMQDSGGTRFQNEPVHSMCLLFAESTDCI
jgi:hypothetical protein